jgi:hypothetical protein
MSPGQGRLRFAFRIDHDATTVHLDKALRQLGRD